MTGLNELTIKSASLLSIEEAANLLSEEDRKYKGYWWLHPAIRDDEFAPDVEPDGSISYCGDYVNTDDTYVRPVLNILLSQTGGIKPGEVFFFGDKPFKIISENQAFCMGDIGKCSFNKTIYDKNNYETSLIKEYIDGWFNQVRA